MRPLIVAALAALTVLLAGSNATLDAQAQTTLLPCFGAPADYVAANDARDGATDGKVSYPEQRIFLEAQGHVKAVGVATRHEMEHIHIGTCFPYAETWREPMTSRSLDMRYVFHHVKNYTITQNAANFVSKGSSGKGFVASAAQLAQLQAAMDASGESTQTVFQNYKATATFGASCRKNVKITMNVVASNANAVVDRWEPGLHATTYIDSGTALTCDPEVTVDQMSGRDWVPTGPNMGYIYALMQPPKASEIAAGPVAEPWTLSLTATGMDASIHVDPNYHGHTDDDGIWSKDLGPLGVVTFPQTIPTDTLPAGVHRLVWVGERHSSNNEPDPADRGKSHSALMVVPFKVDAGC